MANEMQVKCEEVSLEEETQSHKESNPNCIKEENAEISTETVDNKDCEANIIMPTVEMDVKSEVASDILQVANVSKPSELPLKTTRRKRGQIYNKNDDPETIKEKRKRRAVELKLKHLKWTLNQESEVSGKRQKKVPQRFELGPAKKRKSCVDNCQGNGDQLGSIPWIMQQLRDASLYTLRLLHRVIYRKQGMFSEKHIKKSVSTFSGFPFDATNPELRRRREQLEKANVNALNSLCNLLGVKNGIKEDMIDRIIGFLMHPTQQRVEEFLKEVVQEKLMQQKGMMIVKKNITPEKIKMENISEVCNISHNEGMGKLNFPSHLNVINDDWKQPPYFCEGTGVKLKYIRAVISNIHVASESIIELLHRLLYLHVDEKANMRRNILEFSGFRCIVGTNEYVYRTRVLSVLPMDQIKLLCRVLCLPTWHRSRQLLTEGIMDFLSVPRISAMKKRVPPHFADEITFSFDGAQKVQLPELKSVETEEIEIVPDIIIPDETSTFFGYDFAMENDYLGVKLKNFSNIHYQVISTPAAKLNDVHMVLFLKPCPPNNVRKNVLEFSGYPFDELSAEYQCRRALMEQMSIEDLKAVATVLCVSQYIVDESKNSLIDAIMKFLLKPSALLNSSTIMPTISPAPCEDNKLFVVKKRATSTSKNSSKQNKDVKPKFQTNISQSSESTIKIESVTGACNNANVTCSTGSSSETENLVSSLPKSIHIKKLPPGITIKEVSSHDTDEPLSNVKKTVTVPKRVSYLGSDDDDDQPLSKMVGHPNDDQLRLLIAKIMKESKLEDITMKHVIQRVFETYPNYDLSYRKEFIKSIVRQILSQMDDQNCSVSTTVITI